jgi:cobalt-zinc-cadmium efflux system membrane fusion protein
MQEGLNAQITTLSYPDKIFYGKIDRIFNILDPQTKSMKVRVRLANPGFVLKPEMNAVIVVNYEEPQTMLAVPSEAVVFDNSRYYAMVYKDPSHIETREVEVYQQTGKITYIKSGIEEGETVITKNLLLIYDALND